jgi:hypothetical protein
VHVDSGCCRSANRDAELLGRFRFYAAIPWARIILPTSSAHVTAFASSVTCRKVASPSAALNFLRRWEQLAEMIRLYETGKVSILTRIKN